MAAGRNAPCGDDPDDNAGSSDKTLKLYEGHFHDLLADVDKEIVMTDILAWLDARIPKEEAAAA